MKLWVFWTGLEYTCRILGIATAAGKTPQARLPMPAPCPPVPSPGPWEALLCEGADREWHCIWPQPTSEQSQTLGDPQHPPLQRGQLWAPPPGKWEAEVGLLGEGAFKKQT